MATLPSYASLWNEYPDYINYHQPETVKKLIGGAVDAAWITNTCAIRLSRTLNYNKIPVPSRFAGMSTVKGGDGKRYAFRVREITPWLEHTLGKPNHETRKKRGDAFDKSVLASMSGIIGFDIKFADATGHLDLWDGSVFSDEAYVTTNYWTAATRIWLWKAITS